jgi:hypothetical protein
MQATRVGLARLSKLPKADGHRRSEIDVLQADEVLSRAELRHRDDPDGKARWIVLAARIIAAAMVVAAGTAAFFVATCIPGLLSAVTDEDNPLIGAENRAGRSLTKPVQIRRQVLSPCPPTNRACWLD